MHVLSGNDWDAWNRKMRKQLVDSQIKGATRRAVGGIQVMSGRRKAGGSFRRQSIRSCSKCLTDAEQKLADAHQIAVWIPRAGRIDAGARKLSCGGQMPRQVVRHDNEEAKDFLQDEVQCLVTFQRSQIATSGEPSNGSLCDNRSPLDSHSPICLRSSG